MHFTLKNLGRLEEATIDLGQDLIVLTGRNNTSKTYVAHAVYGFLKGHGMALTESVLKPLLPKEGIRGRFELDLVDLITKSADSNFADLGRWYQSELVDVFAADPAFVARTEVLVALDKSILADWISVFLESSYHLMPTDARPYTAYKGSGTGIIVFEPSAPSITGLPADTALQARPPLRPLPFEVVRFFIQSLVSDIIFSHRPYILTAERSAIQLFSRELSLQRTQLVDELMAKSVKRADEDLSSVIGRRARRYPLPIRDGLQIADDLAIFSKIESPYAPFAERLEQDILQGSVKIGEDGEMRFHPEASTAGLEMHLASSSVKSLSPLSFYLRHLAEEGQFLIIDEPELNLHPDNQRHVTRLLVRLARAGLKVMISTHSDYIIREINNAIMLSADTSGALREKYGYEEFDTIRPERLGAYRFDATRARPIPVEPTGISIKSIDDEINRLNRSSQDIYYALFDDPKGA